MTKGPQQFEAGRILASTDGAIGKAGAGKMLSINRGGHEARRPPDPQFEKTELLDVVAFLEDFEHELSDALSVFAPDPYVRMTLHLIRSHLEAKTVTPTSLIGASGVPYATATRRIGEMIENGLIDQRPRTRSGKTFSMHPSEKLLESWMQLSGRLQRLAETRLMRSTDGSAGQEYYFGGSYMAAQSIPPLQVLAEPLRLAGGVRVLVHGDPTFMVMDNLKRRFEQVVGTDIHQRAFSIDRLHQEALKNAERKASRYDIIAVDLPWIGEFAEKDVLMPLDEAMDIARLDPADFHTAGWKAAHWGGRPYGVPAQTTPELLFYRKDIFAEAGMEAPATTADVIKAAKSLHDPARGFTE
jgi:multiple sugar transport system substrate-binding protein